MLQKQSNHVSLRGLRRLTSVDNFCKCIKVPFAGVWLQGSVSFADIENQVRRILCRIGFLINVIQISTYCGNRRNTTTISLFFLLTKLYVLLVVRSRGRTLFRVNLDRSFVLCFLIRTVWNFDVWLILDSRYSNYGEARCNTFSRILFRKNSFCKILQALANNF